MKNKQIYYDKEEVEKLKEKFPACKKQIQDEVDAMIRIYRKIPFKSNEKKRIIHKIKDVVTFYNPNFEDEKKKKYEENQKKKEEERKFKLDAVKVFLPENQAETFNKIQPLFYDKNCNWWLWNFDEYKWEIVDEVDILNMIADNTGRDVISPKERTIILNSLKQSGRKRIPKPIKKTWIQFKNIIYDIVTGEKMDAEPYYFVTNPIPYELEEGNFDTPIMDKIFGEWVGGENIGLLYEIIAYCLIPDYPIHRLFCLIGEGLNGKSCFLRLLKKFIGEENVTATELDTLLSSRFEVTRLYKKLVCIMGETNFSEISKTSILKKLTGQDTIGFEYKNKTPFEDINYAKIIIATNNLPTTTDKTLGFYRRWMIIDFPNRFSEQEDILSMIPEREYRILAFKCVWILKDLLENRKFTNEGTIEERKEKYEAKSNFLEKFIKEFTIENIDSFITKAEFYRKFNDWCKENRHRQVSDTSLGSEMKKLGIETGRKWLEYRDDKGNHIQARCWLGLKWREEL